MSNANYTKTVNTDISALSLLAAIDSDNLQNLVIQSKLSDYANVVSVSADVALDTADLMQGLLDAVYITAPAEGGAVTNALSVGADTEANADALAALFNLSVNTSRVIRFINPSAIGALNTISLGNSSGTNTWVAFVSGATTSSSLTLFVPGESARVKSVAVTVSSGDVVSFTLLNAVDNSLQPVVDVTGSVTLTRAQSGSVINLLTAAVAGPYTVTLPTPVGNAGVNYYIVAGADNANDNRTVTSSVASLLQGSINIAVGAGSTTGVIAVSGNTSIAFIGTADNIGNSLYLVSNGVYWLVQGNSQGLAASFVVS